MCLRGCYPRPHRALHLLSLPYERRRHLEVIFLVGLGLAVLAIWYLTSSYGPKWVRRHTELMLTQQVDEGYIGVDMTPAAYIGLDGTAVTDMRPAGKVEINGDVLDAVAIQGFIHAGARVKVRKYENAQIYVAEL